jgi:hypothetical protein
MADPIYNFPALFLNVGPKMENRDIVFKYPKIVNSFTTVGNNRTDIMR